MRRFKPTGIMKIPQLVRNLSNFILNILIASKLRINDFYTQLELQINLLGDC